MSDELLTLGDIQAIVKLSHNYVRDRLVKRADFPRPALSISQKTRRWSASDVNSWLSKQQAEIAR